MKVSVVILSVLLVILKLVFSLSNMLMVVAPPIIYGLLFTILSVRKNVSYLNELPNTLRILLASIGAVFFSFFSFSYILVGVGFVLAAVVANDEAMRRVYRHKGVIVLAGIDSTGKSTHARLISSWMRGKGIECKVLPFSEYLFLEKISGLMRPRKGRQRAIQMMETRVPPARTSRFSFARPYLALVDNVLFYVLRVVPHIINREYVICDRFIWDNFVKHKALGYRTLLLFRLSTLIKPSVGVVLDLPADVAFDRVEKRERHVRYSVEQYETERREFRKIARMLNYPIFDTNEPIQQTWKKIEAYLSQRF